MANPRTRLAFINRIDNGTLSASSEAANMPVENIQESNIYKTWRGTAMTGFVDADLGGTHEIQVVAGMRLPDSTVSYRVRIGTSQGSGDVHDSGVVTNSVHINTRQFVHVLSSSVFGSHVRVDLDCGPDSVEMGRMFAGPVLEFTHGVAWSQYRPMWRDHSNVSYSISGVKYADIRPRQRGLGFIGIEEGYETVNLRVEELNRICGINKDFLFIMNIDDAPIDKSRFSLWGSMEQSAQIQTIEADSFQFQIEMWAR